MWVPSLSAKLRRTRTAGAIFLTCLALRVPALSADWGVAAAEVSSAPTDADSGPVPICHGDCNGDGAVTIDEIIRIVSIILGNEAATCADIYPGRGIEAAILAVNSALRGCQTFTYRLTSASAIAYSPPPPNDNVLVEEPLSGTFVAVPTDSPSGGANSLFYFSITSVQFQSATFTVSGHRGSIATFTLSDEGTVAPVMSVSINGQGLELCGISTFSVFSGECPAEQPVCEYPPGFQGLEICTTLLEPLLCGTPMCETIRAGSRSGYSLTLFAAPEG